MKMIQRSAMTFILIFTICASVHPSEPLRLGIVGLVHGHVGGFLSQAVNDDAIQLSGVFDPGKELHEKYQSRFSINESLFYSSLEKMLDETKPEAVAVFTSTFDHTAVVEACAQRGIHVMMEKPLAVSNAHAIRIQHAADKHNIHVLVNYETTWYPSHHAMREKIQNGDIGELRKFVARDGHPGPKEIGCSVEFLDWLTDPEQNGAGALFDFGCYGANLITWLMNGERPLSVTAVTQQIKPDVYPLVDDEATIIVAYPKSVGIIQASWNWPINRKDMDVYGVNGFISALNNSDMKIKTDKASMLEEKGTALAAPHDNPLAYLKAVARGAIKPEGLSSLENNMIVTEILCAARESAQSGKTAHLKNNVQ